MCYLRIDGQGFGFVFNDTHEIKSTDIVVKKEEYKLFFEEQMVGKQYRLKDKLPESGGLFDFVEEFVPEPIEMPPNETEILREQVTMLDGALNELLFEIIPNMGGEI